MIQIQLHPMKEQKQLLNKMFGTHRAIYNKLVEESKEDRYKLNKKELSQKYRGISQKHSLTEHLPEYHLQTPEEVMDSTYRDFVKAIESSKALFKALKDKDKKTTFPSLKFKSKKDNSTSIEIRSRSISVHDGCVRFFPTFFGLQKDEGIRVNEAIPELQYSVRLRRTRSSKFYLCIPKHTNFVQTESKRVCAIDPGVRSFISIYDPQGIAFSVDDSKNEIFMRCLIIDRMKSVLTKEKSKRKRNRLRKKIYNTFQRIKAMVNDMHQKTSKWLSENYNEVLLPAFETSKLTSKQKRISCKTSRRMLTWSHYRFKMLLKYKMERSGGRVVDCGEYFTTQTCSSCGRLNRKVKAKKTYTCKSCNYVLDRDVNAARNIYLMNENLLSWSNVLHVVREAYSEMSYSVSND